MVIIRKQCVLLLICCVALSGAAVAGGLEIVAPDRVPDGSALVEIEATTSAADVLWTVYPPEARPYFRGYRVVSLDDAGQPIEPQHLAILAAPPKGRYYFGVTAVVDGRIEHDEHSLDVGGAEPQPDPIDPPLPDPAPPAPKFGPLRVLLVDETAAGSRYREVMSAGMVRDYLAIHCEKWPDGRTPQKYFADQHENFRNMPSWWQGAFDRAKAKGVPSLVIFNGHAEVIVPAPESAAAALVLLQSMGGM